MNILLAYTSVSGNTYALASSIRRSFIDQGCTVDFVDVSVESYQVLNQYDAVVIGTYTWGDGEIPESMYDLYEDIESLDMPEIITGLFGTGDQSFGDNYCGAVDQFTDMLTALTTLVVRLKVEQYPSEKSFQKCPIFVNRILKQKNITV